MMEVILSLATVRFLRMFSLIYKRKRWLFEMVWFGRRLGGFRNLIIEGDSLQIVGALAEPSTNLSNIGHIVEEAKVWLPIVTEEACTHVRHQANGVAHRLACFSLSIGDHCEWIDCPPPFITDLLLEDCL